MITNIFNISTVFPGKQVSVRLNRSQIDKASKDKSSKFSENFNVTFFYDVASEQVITNIFNKANSFSSDTCYVPWKASKCATKQESDRQSLKGQVPSRQMGWDKQTTITSSAGNTMLPSQRSLTGMGWDKQTTITSSVGRMTWTYHAAVSVEFDGDGMGQTNNNNIVSGEYHAAVFVEFDGDWTDKQH